MCSLIQCILFMFGTQYCWALSRTRGGAIAHPIDEESDAELMKILTSEYDQFASMKKVSSVGAPLPLTNDDKIDNRQFVVIECHGQDTAFPLKAVVVPHRGGKDLLFCPSQKVGTSSTFSVMQSLNICKSNSCEDLRKVADVADQNNPSEIHSLCEASSFVNIRNPWDRLVSGYLDKILTHDVVFKFSFEQLVRVLGQIEHPETLNNHFKPTSDQCLTAGKHSYNYSHVLKLEDHFEKDMGHVFISDLDLPKSRVNEVLEDRGHTHKTNENAGELSGLEKRHHYWKKAGKLPSIYKNDVKAGSYDFNH